MEDVWSHLYLVRNPLKTKLFSSMLSQHKLVYSSHHYLPMSPKYISCLTLSMKNETRKIHVTPPWNISPLRQHELPHQIGQTVTSPEPRHRVTGFIWFKEHVKKISVRAQLISNPFHLLCLRCTCHQYKSNTREILATPPRTTPAIFPLLSYIGSHVKLLCAASCLHSLLRCTANAILKLG